MSESAAQEAILPASERTQTIHVVTREVVSNGTEHKEVENLASVFIRPLPFRRWPVALTHITNLFQYMPQNGIDLESEAALAVWVTSVLGSAGDDLFAIIELATDKPAAFFDLLDPDDGLKIAMAVVEVNKDFFVQKVLPLVQQYLPAAKEAIAETLTPTQ